MYLNGLAGKRVDNALAAQAAAVQAAFEKAEMPEATQEDIDLATNLSIQYEGVIKSYENADKKKKGKGVKKFITKYESTFKTVGKISPSFKKHAESVARRKRLDELKVTALKLQGQKPSPERDAALQTVYSEMMDLSKKEKKYLKQGKIVMLIVSIVVGIFTFGAGGAAISGAYQALQAGAIELAKKILLSAALAAAAKGANKGNVKKAQQTAVDLEKYPPDKSLPSFNAMLADSQSQKQAAQEKSNSFFIPAALVTALTLFR